MKPDSVPAVTTTSDDAGTDLAVGLGGAVELRRPRAAGERETSIRRGIEVLLSLGSTESLAAGGLGVTRISELLDREKSQVSRALKALGEYGLVERNHDSTYRLGWRLYVLAELSGQRHLLDAAAPIMRRIAHSMSERVHLSVLQGHTSLTVHSESAGRTVEAVGWTGRATPVYCTSAGRALILDWKEAEIMRTFEKVDFIPLGPRTVQTPAQLAALVQTAHEQGYVVVDEEFEPDLISVAVPIRDSRRQIIASLNVSAPRYRFLNRVEAAAQELLAAAAELEGALYGPGQDQSPTTPSGQDH